MFSSPTRETLILRMCFLSSSGKGDLSLETGRADSEEADYTGSPTHQLLSLWGRRDLMTSMAAIKKVLQPRTAKWIYYSGTGYLMINQKHLIVICLAATSSNFTLLSLLALWCLDQALLLGSWVLAWSQNSQGNSLHSSWVCPLRLCYLWSPCGLITIARGLLHAKH